MGPKSKLLAAVSARLFTDCTANTCVKQTSVPIIIISIIIIIKVKI